MAEDNQNTAPDPGKFNQAKEIAKELAREMNDSTRAGRDLTAEVEKLTKKFIGRVIEAMILVSFTKMFMK